MSELADAIAGDARFYILSELARQMDGGLYDRQLRRVLDLYGIRRDRDWVRTQLRKLEALGAIDLKVVGETLLAHITHAGRAHLEERAVIEGITVPSDIA